MIVHLMICTNVSENFVIQNLLYLYSMPFNRNFTYWIDKRRWKYCFLLSALAMDRV